MSFLTSLFTGGSGVAVIALLAALISGGGVGWVVHEVDNSSYEKLELSISSANQKAMVAAVAKQKSADAISTASEEANIKKQQVIITQTQTIIQKVPVYVTAQIDQSFPLPCAFIRLHDAAASGADPSTITLPTGLVDASTCPVKASDAIGIIVSNYGQYQSVAAQLTALQAWITQENLNLQQSEPAK